MRKNWELLHLSTFSNRNIHVHGHDQVVLIEADAVGQNRLATMIGTMGAVLLLTRAKLTRLVGRLGTRDR